MSGKRLSQLLKQLGYPEDVKPEALEWLFDYSETQPFLQWICENIGEANSLSADELDTFDELRSSGKVFEGESLANALETMKHYQEQSQSLSPEVLSNDIKRLNQQKDNYSNLVRTLASQRDHLASHNAYMSQRNANLRKLEKHGRDSVKSAEENVCVSATELDKVVARLKDSIRQASRIFDMPNPASSISHGESRTVAQASETGEQESPFLFGSDFTALLREEDAFFKLLQSYIERQLVNGLPPKSNEEKTSQFEFLDVSDPTTLLVRGTSREEQIKHCNELKRLKNALPLAEKQHMEAELSYVRTTTAAKVIKSQSERNARTMFLDMDESELRRRLIQKDAELAKITSRVDNIKRVILPSIFKKMAELSTSSVLQGDYDLKLARQDYRLEKQKLLVSILVQQQSRLLLLLIALENEQRSHKDANRLLSVLQREISGLIEAHNYRLAVMNSPHESITMDSASTVAPEDSYLRCAYKALSPDSDDDDDRIISVDSLFGAASKLMKQSQESALSQSGISIQRDQELDTILKKANRLRDILFADAATAEPQMTVKELLNSEGQVSRLIEELRARMDKVLHDKAEKEAMLRYSSGAAAKERNLYSKFFLDPQSLRDEINALEQRVSSRSIK